jgi:hypothetical protein
MDTYLPMIQVKLDEWLQLTLEHPLYAVVLAISVWLLTAILYAFRIASLNKKNLASEQARIDAETQRNTAQQQLQQAQNELTTTVEQLTQQQQTIQSQQQRASIAEQQLTQRNQQIAATIQRLATQFDIGERLLPVSEDLKADELWQQHDKVLSKLIDAVRTEQLAKAELEKFYQTEQVKLAEAETRLSSLQAKLDNQVSLVLSLQQQQTDSQQALANAIKKQQTDAARLAELEQQLATFKEGLTTSEPVKPIITETVAAISIATDNTDSLKKLFKKTEPKPTPVPEAVNEAVQAITTEVLVTRIENTPSESAPTAVVEPTPDAEQVDKGAVLKGWYNRLTTKKPADDVVVPETVLPEPTATTVNEENISASSEKTSAVKGLFKKFTAAKPEITETTSEAVVKSEPAPTEETLENANVTKGLFQRFTAKKAESLEEVTPEPTVVQPESEPVPVPPVEKPVENIAVPPKKITRLRPRVIEPKQTTTTVDNKSSGRIEVIADQLTDTVEGLKSLYGKFFSKDK